MADVLLFREENDKLRAELKLAKASVAPKFDNVADLSAQLSINYTYYSGHEKRSRSRDMTYLEFLQLIAPSLHTPSHIHGAVSAVKSGLIDRFGVPASMLKPKESDVQDALLHLVATGHLKMWPGTTKEGGQVTGYQLTETGTKVWQEMSYVRRDGD
jgi:hypothetical protein